MGKINYRAIFDHNQDEWKALTREPQKYEALLAGHYSDSNHFVYELLQNAEDENASRVVIEYYEDRLVFYHNGDPFDEADVRGVSSMLMGTKDKNDGQTIGHFGMGFKSVFKYTHEPRIYSNNESFAITNYLLPVELKDGWNYLKEKRDISCKLANGRENRPFWTENNLTKIVIPFTKRQNDGSIAKISGRDVVQKLESLNGEILLFLSTIRELYWIDTTSDRYALITLNEDPNDKALVTCKIEDSKNNGKEQISKYLKFKKYFQKDISDFVNGIEKKRKITVNVGIAYKLNVRANNINAVENNTINVYFPTKDETCLPFLVHGSFETAVSREKLMEPSHFNDDLYDKLGELICDSMDEIKKRNLITQNFIRNILIPSFGEERIDDLRDRVSNVFRQGELLPDINNQYFGIDDISIAIPFGMAEFNDTKLFCNTFADNLTFISMSDEKGFGFNDYFVWLRDDLGVNVFTLDDWAEQLKQLKTHGTIHSGMKEYDELFKFYSFVSDYRENSYRGTGSYIYRGTYSRAGAYENSVQGSLADAWKDFRKAPIILNQENKLVAAYDDQDNEQVYLGSSSNYKQVLGSAIVNFDIAKKFKSLLEEGFGINEFNNFQYVKEKVIAKYIRVESTINFEHEEDEDIDKEYYEDIKQILQLMDEGISANKLSDMLKNAYVIRTLNTDGDTRYCTPGGSYVAKSIEDLDLRIYFAGLDEYFCFVDEDYFKEHGISLDKIKLLGVKNRVISEGPVYHEGYGGADKTWKALGNYKPRISIDYWDENMAYIANHPEEKLSREKSRIMLNMLLANYDKFAGRVRYNKTSTYVEDEISSFLRWHVRDGEWIYDKNNELCRIEKISRFDLNDDIYGFRGYTKEAYQTLGFVQKEQDAAADAYDALDSLGDREQKMIIQQWARRNGFELTKIEDVENEDGDNDTFDPNAFVSDEFPYRKVKNPESLLQHVRETFFCADPTKYMPVWRQIRVSKSKNTHKQYVFGMYTNSDGARICQMCKQPTQTPEAIEIANFGIEMDQLHLCLCANCAAKYKILKANNKEAFKKNIKKSICSVSLDYEYDEEEYEISLTEDDNLYFNQTHLAELQEIFALLDKYGVPNEKQNSEENEPKDYETDDSGNKELNQADFKNPSTLDDDAIHNGSFISYKKPFTSDCYDITVQADKNPSHSIFLGKKVGDTVVLEGEKYEIIAII